MAKFKIKRHADTDFTEQQLPHNRIDAFFDCIKLRWRELLIIGIIMLISMIPIFALGIMRDNMISDAISENNINSARYTLLLFDVISIIFYLLPALTFAGAFRVIRNIAWADIVFFKEDFKDGIKLNFKIFALIFILYGTGVFFADFFALTAGADILKSIPIGISAFLLIPIAIFIIIQGTIYNIGFFGALKNGIYLFSKSIFRSIAASLVAMLPLTLSLISNTITKHICLASYMVIFMPLVCLGLFLFGCTLLDKYINVYSHPEIVDKGLFKVQESDE